jgi:hypothetical protein
MGIRELPIRCAFLLAAVAGCQASVAGSKAGVGAQPPVAGVGVVQPPTTGTVLPSGTAGAARAEPPAPGRASAGVGAARQTASAGRPAAQGGMSAAVGGGGAAPVSAAGAAASAGVPTEKFSFFVTSLEAMRKFSNSENGFGGDLRNGQPTGLEGADKLCNDIAESSMPGANQKVWRAFLSTQAGGANGGPSHARDRIGNGPWYDRTGRLVAENLEGLLMTRPSGGDSTVASDLPNERGEPNRGNSDVDNHDTVTGSNAMGQYSGGPTCEDWTSSMTAAPPAAGSGGGGRNNGGFGAGFRGPMCGHSWPSAQSGMSWIQAHQAPGCAPSVSLTQTGAGSGDGIGNSGGYGGIYCFALTP